MIFTRIIRGKMLVATLASLLASVQGRADDTRFLPDGCVGVFSIDLANFLTSKMYPKGSDPLQIGHEMDRLVRASGVPSSNLDRLTLGVDINNDDGRREIYVVTTLKPITPEQIKSEIKYGNHIKNVEYTEIRVGKHVIYEPRYQYHIGKELIPNYDLFQAFCVVAEKKAIYGPSERLKIVLDRKKATFSVGVETELKSNGLNDAFISALDIRAISAYKRSQLKQMAEAVPGLSDLLEGIHTVSLRGNEKNRFHCTATVWCKDAIYAAKVKKVADAGVVLLKELFKDSEDRSAERRKMNKAMHDVLNAVRLSVVGSQVLFEVSVDPVTAINALAGLVPGETKKSPEPR